MTTRANWHVDLVTATDEDPFSTPPGQQRLGVEQLGRPIDLDDEVTLNERLISTINAEGDLHGQGITCPIRDAKESHCSACPIRHTGHGDPHKKLCDVGMEQEQITTALAVRRHARASSAQP